ncbi:gliding motility-associated C-terminal domain-containing protein, partial [Elysia marginata]
MQKKINILKQFCEKWGLKVNVAAATPELAASISSDKNNPLGLNEAVTLTCTGSGGTAPLEYAIRLQSDTTTPTYVSENTLAIPTNSVGTRPYVCDVKDANGNTKTSKPISLEYVDALTVGISGSPEGDITVNTNVEITCKAAGGTGPYSYVIQKAGLQAGTESTLTDTSSTAGQMTYKCIVTDAGAGGATAESPELSVNFI